MATTITTEYARGFEVVPGWLGAGSKHLTVTDTFHDVTVTSILSKEETLGLAQALLPEDSVVITDLPEATSYDSFGKTIVKSGNTRYYTDKDPEYIETFAKEQLAIAKFIREHRAEEERLAKLAAEAEAAQQAKRNKRRDELAKQFASQSGNESYRYYLCSDLAKNAIDHIIDLEEAQAGQEAAAKPAWV